MSTGPRREAYLPRRPGSRRARFGLKPSHEIAALRDHGLTRRWLEALEGILPASVRAEGEVFAREGMVMTVEFHAGLIEGTVQSSLPSVQQLPPSSASKLQLPGPPPGALFGRSAQDCRVKIDVPRYDERVWQDAVRSLATDGAAIAPILAGDLPADLDDVMARHGVPLPPRADEQVSSSCSCDEGAVCVHRAAVIVLAADRLRDDASLGLILRGLNVSELIERVRIARTASARRSASSAPPPTQPALPQQDSLPELSLEEFWRTGPELDDLAHLPPPNHAPHALLRRLGPSPLGGQFPLVGLLASAYDTIKAHAEKLRDEAEEKEE